MKMRGALWALLALITALAMADRNALGNVAQHGDTPAGLFGILAYVLAPAPAGPGTRYLQQAGVEPDTVKARIVEAWFDRLRADPAIAVAVPGGAAGLEARLRDDAARDANGVGGNPAVLISRKIIWCDGRLVRRIA